MKESRQLITDTLIQIDGSDHFFRDLYFDDMFDELLEFIQ